MAILSCLIECVADQRLGLLDLIEWKRGDTEAKSYVVLIYTIVR